MPVMMMLDECIGHMTEKVVIPECEQIAITPRRFTHQSPEEFRLFAPKDDLVPDMVKAGDGYKFHVTGLTHDERGYPSMNVETQDRLVRRMQDKLKPFANGRALFEAVNLDDAEVVVVSYGITSRVAQRAAATGARAGRTRGNLPAHLGVAVPGTAHPRTGGPGEGFCRPGTEFGPDGARSGAPSAGRARVIPVPHAGGSVHKPEVILQAILEAAR